MRKRVFLAFPVPLAVRRYLAGIAEELERRCAPDEVVRWVGEDGLHVTTHFLGEQEEQGILSIKKSCEELVGKYAAVTVTLTAIDAFPSADLPRVIIVPLCEDDGFVLRRLQNALGKNLEQSGIDVDHRLWTPHITLGRVKTAIEGRKLKIPVEPRSFNIEQLELIESRLTDDGALYTPLAVYKLST
ncbi:RNA 2',3'-cyclic phosphodiesterase [Patescibacteria group bacterium]|nr:MAG: RNA 2',3'-cyclic phosphodiesterase [Patescibacteria group bacterium]